MRDLSCLNTIINDDLAVHIDLSSLKSWDLNSGFTSISLSKWSGAFSSDIFLYDFGLTGFDNGRVNEMTDAMSITPQNTKLTLYRVGYNTPTGGTFYDGYGITGITTPTTGLTVGNHFILDGGYLQGFFKLKDYAFQVMPYRYGKGVTIETVVYLTPNSFNDGYFLLLGARAEDKYIPSFSGECVSYTASTSGITYGSRGAYVSTTLQKLTSGVTTSEDNFLDSVTQVTVVKKAISDQNHTEEIEIENLNNDIDNNIIGFYLSSDRKIGYSRIDSKGTVVSEESSHSLTKTGWTIITLTFNPYEDILDKSLLDCTALRTGDFYVHVNGRQFWKIENFNEFYFRGFKNSREKQLGVPYNVSWGGGSFGLKHSYHWDLNPQTIFDENSQAQVASGFSFVINPTVVYECPPDPISGFTQYLTVSADTNTFHNVDPCDPMHITPNTVLAITHDGATGDTTTTEYYLEYGTDLQLISNRDYTFTVNFYDRDVFRLWSTGEAGMFFVANVDIEVLEEEIYTTNNNLPNEWSEIRYKIRLQKNSNIQFVKVGLYVKSDMPLNNGFAYYFDKFKYVGSDKLVQDNEKDNQLVEQIFDKSFIGGIQKLRIYDNALNSQEILHNAMIEAKNRAYGFVISKGGRLIYE
jgi:hypothetical protein